jgi:vancomycin resistance protein YoaR
LCLFAGSLCFYLLWLDGAGRVFPNVTVGAVSAGGLDRPGLRSALVAWLGALGAGAGGFLGGVTIELVDPVTGRAWTSDGDSLRLGVDLEATIGRAFAAGRRGEGVLPTLTGIVRCSASGVRVVPALVLDYHRLATLLADIAAEVNVAPANTSLEPQSGEIRAGRPGRILDPVATEEVLREAVAAGVLRASGGSSGLPGTVFQAPLAFAIAAPKGHATRLSALDRDRLSSFSTTFDRSQVGRAWNIALAAARLDGAVLEPDDVISFNGLVGARTREAGFREAPEIVDNELVPGHGGGVCQVATTVCSAALLADLEVVERFHHSRPLTYIGLGRDATVSYPSLDLVIRNSRAFPVVLTATVQGDEVTVCFWGRQTLDIEVRLLAEESDRRPAGCLVEVVADLPPGARTVIKEPFDGRDVRLWREVVQAGRTVRRELVWVDHYEPITGLVRVGPASLAEPVVPGATRPGPR